MAVNILRSHHGSEPPQAALAELSARNGNGNTGIDAIHAQNVRAAAAAAGAGVDMFVGDIGAQPQQPPSFGPTPAAVPPPPLPFPGSVPRHGSRQGVYVGANTGTTYVGTGLPFQGPGLLTSLNAATRPSDELMIGFHNGAAPAISDPYMPPGDPVIHTRPPPMPQYHVTQPDGSINMQGAFIPMGPTSYPVRAQSPRQSPRPSPRARARSRPKIGSQTNAVETFDKICGACGYDQNGQYYGWCWSCKTDFRPGAYSNDLAKTAAAANDQFVDQMPSPRSSLPAQRNPEEDAKKAEIYSLQGFQWACPPPLVREILSNPSSPLLRLITPQEPPQWMMALYQQIDEGKIDEKTVPSHVLRLKLLHKHPMPPWRGAPGDSLVPPTSLAPSAQHVPLDRAPLAASYPPGKDGCMGCVDGCSTCMRLVTDQVVHQIRTYKRINKNHMPLWFTDMVVDPRSPFLRAFSTKEPPPWLSNIWRYNHVVIPGYMKPAPSKAKAVVVDDTITFDCLLQEALKDVAHTTPPDNLSASERVAYWRAELSEYEYIIESQTKHRYDLEAITEDYKAEAIKVEDLLECAIADSIIEQKKSNEPPASSPDASSSSDAPNPVVGKVTNALEMISKRNDIQHDSGLKSALSTVVNYIKSMKPGPQADTAQPAPSAPGPESPDDLATETLAALASNDEIQAMLYEEQLLESGLSGDMDAETEEPASGDLPMGAEVEIVSAIIAPTSWEDGATCKKQKSSKTVSVESTDDLVEEIGAALSNPPECPPKAETSSVAADIRIQSSDGELLDEESKVGSASAAGQVAPPQPPLKPGMKIVHKDNAPAAAKNRHKPSRKCATRRC